MRNCFRPADEGESVNRTDVMRGRIALPLRASLERYASHVFLRSKEAAMRRRDFLAAAATAALANAVRAAGPPGDVRITRVVAFNLPSRRSKVAGRNAIKDVHGDAATDRMVRLFTNSGVEAIGNCRADESALASLIGKDPFEFYRSE